MSLKNIPYGRQEITDEDIQAVVDILKSDFLTTGPAIDKFEKCVTDYCGAKYGVAVANASAALQMAAQALDLAPGDFLWTTPNTFVASANCADHLGAKVDFVDIDPITYNLSATELEKKLRNTSMEKLPKVVIPVHFAGQPCDMEKIHQLSIEFGFKVIEDAAHAIGSIYNGKKIGACEFSTMTIYSFHPVKNITTGEGGFITTNDERLYHRLREMRTLGITRSPDRMRAKPYPGAWYYEQVEFGYNYRMTDIEASLGISQMKRLESFIEKRNRVFDRYNTALKGLPLILPKLVCGDRSAWHLYVVQIDSRKIRKSRREVFDQLREAGIGVNVHYIPVHWQPVYEDQGFNHGDFPQAEQYYENAISLPIYYTLTDQEQDRVVSTLKSVLTSS